MITTDLVKVSKSQKQFFLMLQIYWPLALEVNEFLKSNNFFHTVRLLDTSE